MAVAQDSLKEDTLLALSEKLKAWNENLRVLTDMRVRLDKLKEDVRLNRKSEKTEIPASTSIIPREIRPVYTNSQPIKLKDAIETVPVFDGHRPSIFQFLRACKRARGMMPRNQEPQLVKLLMNELRGYAFLAVEDSEVLKAE